jgi:hypothetical protein
MDPRTTSSGPAADRPARGRHARRRPPVAARRPALYLGVAAAGALLVNVLIGTEPAAQAEAGTSESVSVAQELGLTSDSSAVDGAENLRPLEDLAASRSSREADRSAAAQAQAKADQAERDRLKADAKAKADATAKAVADAAAKAKAAADAAAKAGAAKAAAAKAAAAPAAEAVTAAAPATAVTQIAHITNSAGNVRPQVQAAANAVVSNVPGVAGLTLGGTRSSATDPHGHPSGLALDYMVLSDSSLGDAIVQYHRDHWSELGVEYLIWQQRYLGSPGGSWEPMSDRGSPTANHMDHVHVNYVG